MNARKTHRIAAFVMAMLLSAPSVAAPDRPDPGRLAPPEVAALQRQLADARCYSGALDGKPSDALGKALAACPDPRPTLRIETGMHVATIWRIGVDAQCRLLASGSDDKTVRLWSMPEGRLIRTQRLPIGGANNGKVNAVALTPDGTLVAAGGWDAAYETISRNGIYLFDAATGTQMRRLGAFENVINHLAFSPDGTRLAVSLGSGQGVRVLDVATGRELLADRDFAGMGSYGVAFGPDGTFYAVGDDGFLRRYSRDLKLTNKVATTGGKQPFSVSSDPSGRRLAVGFAENTAVEFYDAQSLKRLGAADTKGTSGGNLARVAWSRDGSRLYAGGRYQVSAHSPIRTFTPDGRRLGADIPVSDNTIMWMTPCGDSIAFGTGDPSIGLFRPEGKSVTLARGHTADMRNKLRESFAVSTDGTRLRFGLGVGSATPILFDLDRGTLSDAPNSDSSLVTADTAGLPVTGWEDTFEPRLKGNPIALGTNERARSLAVRPDRAGFVLGTDYWLRAYDATGKERWPLRAAPGTVWGVNLVRGGDLIVTAYGDGTIRWHRWSDGQELLALFIDRVSRAWVAWTPSGYYSASPGAEDMIGWQVNRGWEQPADFFPASKFRDQYARPDIVGRVLATLDETEAVRQANAARPAKAAIVPISERLPPVVSIVSPMEGSTVEGDGVTLNYILRSPSNLPVDGVEVTIDGRPLGAERGLGRTGDALTAVKSCLSETRGFGKIVEGRQGCPGSISLSLPPGTSEVGLFARSGDKVSEVAKIRLTRAAAARGAELLKPKLYALVVGISNYANSDYRLGYAAKDAQDFTSALQHQKGGLYGEVAVRSLLNEKATATAIRDELDWLTHEVTSQDVGLVYFAGHGVLDERDRFYFLAADSDVKRLRATGLPREDIKDALDALPGKALLFLDTCHSGAVAVGGKRRGNVDINTVVNDFTRSERGVVVFTASTGRQVSQENATWGNGAFTKAVIEGLGLPGQRARADLLNHGQITTSELDAYVRDRVKTLTGGQQSPIMIRPPTVPDFAFALVR